MEGAAPLRIVVALLPVLLGVVGLYLLRKRRGPGIVMLSAMVFILGLMAVFVTG